MSLPMKCGRFVILALALGLSMACDEHSRLVRRAEQGDPVAMRELGDRIWSHTSGRKDEVDEALMWLERAAEKGDVKAMYERASIAGDSPKALYWYRKGAEAGDPNCMGKYAEAYRFGYLGLEKDENQYRYWMDKAMAIDKERSKDWRR